MKLLAFCTGILVFSVLGLTAQPGFEILKDVKKIEIPFEFKNNLIIVNVTFGRIFPLKFIFDTGAENTILSERHITDLLGVTYEREFKILGSDMKTELTAYLVRGIHLRIEDMVVPNHSLLVLEADYFHLDEMMGLQIHGILGADIFKGLVVKINYERRVITLTKNRGAKFSDEGYFALPILVERNKPYLETGIRIQTDSVIRVKLLLDTGAMLSLLLNTETHPDLKPPPHAIKGNIGAGLGGFIEGYLGRVSALEFGELACREVLTNFQELPEGIDTAMLRGRNGIIGNEVLSRFFVVIDYPAQMLYLKPNRSYEDEFEFDKSGLVVIAANVHLNQFLLHSVLPGSPAAVAGLLPGDEIRWLNHSPAGLFSLERIHQILKKKEGKKITMVVRRNGEKIKFSFQLRKLV
ncbi:MAG: aspartyl protease family protein [Bacteroidetes bacterium]|nr:aspartyl protease family protein [Bacteroidota bacterium]